MMVYHKKYESFPHGVVCSSSYFCALFEVGLLQPRSPESVYSTSHFSCQPSVPLACLTVGHHLPPQGCSGFKALLPRQDRAPSPSIGALSVVCSCRFVSRAGLFLMVTEVTSFQPSPSKESPFTSTISLDSACPSFHKGSRRRSFNILLTPLMLKSLLTFSHCSFTYSTHAHLLQAR